MLFKRHLMHDITIVGAEAGNDAHDLLSQAPIRKRLHANHQASMVQQILRGFRFPASVYIVWGDAEHPMTRRQRARYIGRIVHGAIPDGDVHTAIDHIQHVIGKVQLDPQ